jgi:hypothetical protein
MNSAALGGAMPMGQMPPKKKEEKIPKLIQNDTRLVLLDQLLAHIQISIVS